MLKVVLNRNDEKINCGFCPFKRSDKSLTQNQKKIRKKKKIISHIIR